MKLMTKAIENALKKLPIYSQDGVPEDEKKIVAKFFFPFGSATWYVAEGNKMENGDWEFFGYVVGDFPEWGYFTLSELEEIGKHYVIGVERDKWFTPCKFGEMRGREYGVA